ncbi:MAG: type III-A CRISPR-associated protein Csm2 [Rectinema subterraneum]|uniref:type III-A CRISPR-associated protein Csm2 n=1 Tax=Rectinema subterraneum TaxID=2653714 RepID=UPI003C7D5235
MMQFYKTGTETIRPELLGQEAENAAAKVLQVTPTQMRRIFSQIKSLAQRLEKGESWDVIAPLVQLQRAHIAYTIKRGRENNKNNEQDWVELEKIINEGIASVRTQKDYVAFAQYFEALYAFFYAKTKQKV